MSAADKLAAALETMKERGKVYGDPRENFLTNGRLLQAMFPSGLTLNTPEDFARMVLFTLISVKVCRYGNNFSGGGHQDSVHDLGVYAFLLEDFDDMMAGGK